MKTKSIPYSYNRNKHPNIGKSPLDKGNTKNNFYMIPLIFIVAILPFIMRLHLFNSSLSQFNWYPNIKTQIDIFLYYKQIAFITTAIIMLIIIFYIAYTKKSRLKFSRIFIYLLLYGFMSLISTLFSKYSSLGLLGIADHFESIFVVLGYCLVTYYAFNFIEREMNIRVLLKWFIVSLLVLGVLGILQITGNDFFSTSFGLKTILPRIYWNQLSNFKFTFGPNRVYLTLYNPNYVGVFISLIAPIIIGLSITETRKNVRIVYVLVLFEMAISLLGSQSKTGFLSFIISLCIILIIFRKYIFKNKKFLLIITGFTFLILSILFIYKFDTIRHSLSNYTVLSKTNYLLEDIKTEEKVIIKYNNRIMNLDLSNGELVLNDENGLPLSFTKDIETGACILNDSAFAGIEVVPLLYENIMCIKVSMAGKDWIFTNQLGDATYYYLNDSNKFDKIFTADSALFTGYEPIATGRGYIWSRTIPLLKNNLLLGSGADTFVTQFPQQDYVYLHNAGFSGQVLTKPHSLFLQIGVQSGVLSLIAFLGFYITYFISSIKLYRKGTFDNIYYQTGVSIFIGSISYMISGITNDSTITVAPVFWVLIGVGLACNYKIINSNSK